MKRTLALALTVSIFVISCSWSPQNIAISGELNDISNLSDLSHLRAMAFMGGSVYYDASDPAGSSLMKGAVIGIRLGHVNRQIADDNRAIFSDESDKAMFGTITVESVDTDSIAIYYKILDMNGGTFSSGVRDIPIGCQVDLDSDSLPDLEYAKGLRNRPGLESACFLSFASSKDDLNTTMFALIPEQYSNGRYPNGIMGINNDGKMIISKYQGNTSARSISKGVVYGDYVLDNHTGKYEKVITWSSGASPRALSETDTASIENPPAVSFAFIDSEFLGDLTARALLLAIPEQVRGVVDNQIGEKDSLVSLNALLVRSDLVQTFIDVQDGPIPSDSIGEVLTAIPSLTQDQLIQLNRLYIQNSYPSICPSVGTSENPLSEIFQLLSCLIRNPEATGDEGQSNVGEGSRSISRALSPSEYDVQKNKIEEKWAKYKPIIKLTDKKTLAAIRKFFGSGEASSSSTGSSEAGAGSKLQFSPFDEFVITTADKLFGIAYTNPENVPPSSLPEKFVTGPDGTIDLTKWESNSKTTGPTVDDIKIDVGVFGYFSISWGNIEGGAAIAAHVLADTNITITAGTKTKYPTASGTLAGQEMPATISLRLFDSPPIQIGVVSLTFAIDGGVSFPVSLSSSLEMSTGSRLAFCGLYGAEAHAKATYGVEWIAHKVLWFRVWLPSISTNFDAGAGILNDTAYYAGPTDWVIVKSTPLLESASASISFTPTVYIQPKVLFNQVLWVGFKASVGEELKFTLSTKNVPSRWYPDIHGVGSAQLKIDLSANAGLSVTIPIINYRWEPSLSIPIYSAPTKVYTWNAF